MDTTEVTQIQDTPTLEAFVQHAQTQVMVVGAGFVQHAIMIAQELQNARVELKKLRILNNMRNPYD